MIRRLGDVVADAAQRLAQAGFAATCGMQRTNNLGGDYTQAVCSIPGYPQGFDAHATMNLSLPQIRAILASGQDPSAQGGWMQTLGGQQDSTWSGVVSAKPAISVPIVAQSSPASANSPLQPAAGSAPVPASALPKWALPAAAAAIILLLVGGRA